MKAIISIPINPKFKYEWATREEGSYEDSKRDEKHVHVILSRSPRTRLHIKSKEELLNLQVSAGHCCTWQNGEEFSDKADAYILKMSRKLNTILIS